MSNDVVTTTMTYDSNHTMNVMEVWFYPAITFTVSIELNQKLRRAGFHHGEDSPEYQEVAIPSRKIQTMTSQLSRYGNSFSVKPIPFGLEVTRNPANMSWQEVIGRLKEVLETAFDIELTLQASVNDDPLGTTWHGSSGALCLGS